MAAPIKKQPLPKEIALVYLVAGISSRFGGKIKQFAKVTDTETLIEYSMNQAIRAGFTKIIFVVGKLTENPFKEKFQDNYKGIPILYALQDYDSNERDKPWGTTDALVSAKSLIDCPFVFCNGDDIYGENTFKMLFNHLKTSSEEATIGYKLADVIPEEGAVKRGIFQIHNNYVQKITETFNIEKSNLNASGTNLADLCSMNIFALHPSTVKMLSEILSKFRQSHQGDRSIESLIPSDISSLAESGKIKIKIYSTTDKWFGVTNPQDEEVIREQIKQFHHK
jgi:NDP-sugar pyrophosphorylase family protein